MLSKNKTFIAFTVKMLLCVSALHAQQNTDSLKQKATILFYPYSNNSALKQPATATQLPGNFYAKRLPFFCNKELQVQKTIGFPVKFRLGSVEYCDRLEGKNN